MRQRLGHSHDHPVACGMGHRGGILDASARPYAIIVVAEVGDRARERCVHSTFSLGATIIASALYRLAEYSVAGTMR